MGLMDGKRGLVLGVVNDYSIAWGISEQLHNEGAQLGFTHLPDKDPVNPKMARRVRKCVEQFNPKLFMPCDVQSDTDPGQCVCRRQRDIWRTGFCCPFDRLRTDRRPERGCLRLQPRRLQDVDGHQRLQPDGRLQASEERDGQWRQYSDPDLPGR